MMGGDNFSQQEWAIMTHKWGGGCFVCGFCWFFLTCSFVLSLLCSIFQCSVLGITNGPTWHALMLHVPLF